MVSSPLDLTPSTSVDVAGISIATAMPSLTDNRAGSVYDPTVSACAPVFVTPVGNSHLVTFARRWMGGDASSGHPGYFTSYQISTTPGWMLIDSSGVRKPVNKSYDIPMSTPHSLVTLMAGCARPPYNVYLLNSVVDGDSTKAVLQYVFYNPGIDTFGMDSEEVIPDAYLGGPPVSLVYNIPGIDNLILSADVVAKIFAGIITTWDHSAIAAINGGISLPSLPITPVYRSDSSATTGSFQTWLTNNTTWTRGSGNAYAGVGTAVTGPAAAVAAVSTVGAITYAEKPLAAQSNFPSARFGTLTVTFDKGVFLLNRHLIVFGSTPAGRVCMARKEWGRIGIASTPWEYYTGTGWSSDPSEVQQVTTTTGLLTTVGPISAFSLGNGRVRISAVNAVGSLRYAQVYSLTPDFQWKPGSQLQIGSADDGSYQGGTLQFQSQLRVVEDLIDTPNNVTAVPYCFTKKVFGAGTSGLRVTWGAWQISRLY